MNKKIIAGILILIIIGICLAIYFRISHLKNDQPENIVVSNSSPTSTPTSTEATSTENNQNKKMNYHIITLKTNLGEIQIQTFDSDAPKTANNFVTLAQKGFYNNLIFHRVIKSFMIQGGDPSCGITQDSGMCGAGGPGYQFEDELNPDTASYKAGYVKGVVAMANSGPNTNGSQFFIMLENNDLPHNYTIFGKVIKGQEVVDAIGNVKTNQNDRPITPVIINSTSVN
ncbi:MAG: peptidylprolyl isomerase [Candidatus Paceibacterota bacterium]